MSSRKKRLETIASRQQTLFYSRQAAELGRSLSNAPHPHIDVAHRARRGGRRGTRIYGNMGNHMKTTIELPDDLLLAAKKKALESRTTLRALFERALRRELTTPRRSTKTAPRLRIRWVTAKGKLPPGLDLSDREAMYSWFEEKK